MNLGFVFFFDSILLGIGLAMDAFSVSLANGLNEPKMKLRKISAIAFIFALFQAVMPLIGWFCVHTVAEYFALFEKLIPFIAFGLLLFVGGKMLIESIKGECDCEQGCKCLGLSALLLQAVATSIDALSVGFTIANYSFLKALLCVILISAVTFVICFMGVLIGRKFGTKLSRFAGILGGAILIFIGTEILVSSFFK